MNGVLEAAAEVDQKFSEARLRYCLIGGIALQRWGQPRTTLDVDVTVMAEFGSEGSVIGQLLQLLEPRIKDAAEFAKQSRVVLGKTPQGIGVDISLGSLPFESRMVDRASAWTIDDDRSLRTCSAEDLIVQKAFASRDQDWVDVSNVVTRQGDSIDHQLILRESQPLFELKDDLAGYERLQELLVT